MTLLHKSGYSIRNMSTLIIILIFQRNSVTVSYLSYAGSAVKSIWNLLAGRLILWKTWKGFRLFFCGMTP